MGRNNKPPSEEASLLILVAGDVLLGNSGRLVKGASEMMEVACEGKPVKIEFMIRSIVVGFQ